MKVDDVAVTISSSPSGRQERVADRLGTASRADQGAAFKGKAVRIQASSSGLGVPGRVWVRLASLMLLIRR